MVIAGIIWVERLEWKIWIKHHVTREEVEEIFRASPDIYFVEKGTRPKENLYIAAGKTQSGRLLLVWFIHKKGNKALPISARQMTPKEKKQYGKTKKR